MDSAGKDAGKSFAQNLTDAATKGIAALLGFKAVKKLFVEIGQSMKEISENIDKFNDKIDVAGFRDKKKRDQVGSMSEFEQREIVGAEEQRQGWFDKMKLAGAKLGALGTTSFLTYAGMLKGKGFEESRQDVMAEQRRIWDGMKAVQAEKDAAKAIAEQTKAAAAAEELRLKHKEAYNKAVDEEMKKWLQANALQRAVQQWHLDQAKGARDRMNARIQVAGEHNQGVMEDAAFGNPTALDDWQQRAAGAIGDRQKYAQEFRHMKSIRDQQLEARKQKTANTTQQVMDRLFEMTQTGKLPVKVELDK